MLFAKKYVLFVIHAAIWPCTDTVLASKENKDQVACSLVRDTLKLVEVNGTLYKQFIDHMLQINSIFLKKSNENKGDVEEINTIAFGDTGVTKKKIDKRKSNI